VNWKEQRRDEQFACNVRTNDAVKSRNTANQHWRQMVCELPRVSGTCNPGVPLQVAGEGIGANMSLLGVAFVMECFNLVALLPIFAFVVFAAMVCSNGVVQEVVAWSLFGIVGHPPDEDRWLCNASTARCLPDTRHGDVRCGSQ
jgi:hypothetical protein